MPRRKFFSNWRPKKTTNHDSTAGRFFRNRPSSHQPKERKMTEHESTSRRKRKSAAPQVPPEKVEVSESESEDERTSFEKLYDSFCEDYPHLAKLDYQFQTDSEEENDDCDEDSDDDDDDDDDESDDLDENGDDDDGNEEDMDEDKNEDGASKTPARKGKKRKREDSEHSEIEVEPEESDSDSDVDDNMVKENDPFTLHWEKELPDSFYDTVPRPAKWKKRSIEIPGIGKACFAHHDETLAYQVDSNPSDLRQQYVKQRLCEGLREKNERICQADLKKKKCLTPLQRGLFAVMNKYQDLYCSRFTHQNWNKIRFVYCLHILNHVLKSRSRVVAHDTKKRNWEKAAAEKAKAEQMMSKKKRKKLMKKAREQEAEDEEDPEEYRDQGFFRPKVLVLLPTCESAYRVVCTLTALLRHDKLVISGQKRFKKEFHSEEDESYRKGLKPEDFEATFAGNIEEYFRIGIRVAKKSLHLYSNFYSSDIIIASPLGLKDIIKSKGEEGRDYDFLSSIEVLVVDQADFMLMQNWDHVLDVFDDLHMMPTDSRDTDLTRVRLWALQGRSQHYRQTLMFSSFNSFELISQFFGFCHNHAGKVQVFPKIGKGSISKVYNTMPHHFYRMDTQFETLPDDRFKYFTEKILPKFQTSDMARTLIFIPDYCDFVRLRNYFRRHELSFVHINEYDTAGGITRARSDFFFGKAHFLLYTERLHFYRRFKIRGANHLLVYQLPHFPHFYTELCERMGDLGKRNPFDDDSLSCTVLYSPFEASMLEGVVGKRRATKLLKASSARKCFTTG